MQRCQPSNQYVLTHRQHGTSLRRWQDTAAALVEPMQQAGSQPSSSLLLLSSKHCVWMCRFGFNVARTAVDGLAQSDQDAIGDFATIVYQLRLATVRPVATVRLERAESPCPGHVFPADCHGYGGAGACKIHNCQSVLVTQLCWHCGADLLSVLPAALTGCWATTLSGFHSATWILTSTGQSDT